MFLDSISTFTFYELFTCDTFIFYTVLTTIVPLDGVSLKRKVVLTLFYLFPLCFIFHVVNFTLSMWGSGCTWYLDSNGQDPFISEFLNSLYDCPYGSFLLCAFREQTSCLSCYLYSYLEVVLLFTIDISFQLIFSMLL